MFKKISLLLFTLACIISIFEFLNLPASFLIGAIISGIIYRLFDDHLTLPAQSFATAQNILGAVLASRVVAMPFAYLQAHFISILSTTFVIMLASFLIGLYLTKYIKGTTAIYGVSPGGASVMLVAATNDPNANEAIVAFMQYYRVLLMSVIAIALTFYLDIPPVKNQVHNIYDINLVLTIILAIVAGFVGNKLKLPSANMLFPMIVLATLASFHLITINLNSHLLHLVNVLIGLNVGLKFTKKVFLEAKSVFIPITLSILALIVFCFLISALLMEFMGIDLLSAYLATSPGGIDTIFVIANSMPVEMGLILTMQVLRLIVAILISPLIAKLIIKVKNGRPSRT